MRTVIVNGVNEGLMSGIGTSRRDVEQGEITAPPKRLPIDLSFFTLPGRDGNLLCKLGNRNIISALGDIPSRYSSRPRNAIRSELGSPRLTLQVPMD